jgi:hypothetical protein
MLKYQSGALFPQPIIEARKKCQEKFKKTPIRTPWVVVTVILIIFFKININGLCEKLP